MASVRLERVEKTYPNGHVAARGLDIEIADGEFMVLVGPSGCGKSTALRMIAGLETPTAGRVLIGDRDVTALPPQERDIAMVFQSYALYPHMTVRENLAFGLRMRGTTRDEIAQRVERIARSLGLDAVLERKPASSRAASASASRLAEPWCATRRSFCSTSRSRTWTPSSASRPARSSPAPSAAQGDDRLRHPRSGGGDHPGRPGDGHAGWRGGAGRAADGRLPPAGDHVRGRVRRLARHELPRRRAAWRRIVVGARRTRPRGGGRLARRTGRARSRSASGRTTSRSWRRMRATCERGSTSSNRGAASCSSTYAWARMGRDRRSGWWRRPSSRSRWTRWWDFGATASASIGSTPPRDAGSAEPG